MTISTVNPASSTAARPDTAATPSPTPPAAGNNVNTQTWQPPAKSPLPPGQGTRIDQLV